MKMKLAAVMILATASLLCTRGQSADAIAATPDKKADAKSPQTLAEADPELRKKLSAMLEDAKKEARAKMDSGVEIALAKHPKISNDMAQLLRSSSTHETWLKLVVDGAFKANAFLIKAGASKDKTGLEQQYVCSCMAISRMRDVRTGLEGDAFIDDYITASIAQTQGAEKSPGDDSGAPADKGTTKRHKSHVVGHRLE